MAKKHAALALASLLAFIFFSAGNVLADPFSLTTSPVVQHLSIKPGTTSTSTLEVETNSSHTVQLSIELATFSASGTSGSVKFSTLSPSNPLYSYIHFASNTFQVPPGVWIPIKMTLNLPPQAQLGYYFAVLFKPMLPNQATRKGNVIKSANAVLVLIDTHSANEHRDLTLSSFTTTSGSYQFLPATFKVNVRNSGNIFLAPTGDIFIGRTANFTHPLAVIPINPGQGNVLPDSVRSFSAEWSNGFPVFKPVLDNGQPVIDKSGAPKLQLKWNFSMLNKFRFGKYYAHLALVYNDGKQMVPIDDTISFWVIPWELMIIGLFIVLVVAIGLFGFSREVYKRIAKRKVKP